MTRKIRNPRVAWLTAVLMCLLLSACGRGSNEPSTPPLYERPEQGFFAVDSYGQKLYAFESETAGYWYLFVPSTEDISTMALYVSPDITEVSSGTLDQTSGVVRGLFSAGNEAVLSGENGKVTIKVMKSQLPGLHIVLNDVTLEVIHADKSVKCKDNSVYLSDPSGEHNLVAENSVEMKGRGNSTWSFFDKKGYQIKFSEKTSVLGMEAAKKWVLLANASDDSMMRTQLTYLTASQMGMEFVPDFAYVDLWINGEYRGTYLLGEKVEISSGRLALDDPLGALFEHDEAFWQEEEIWTYSKYLSRHFVLKESVDEKDEERMQAATDDFCQAVDELAKYLFSTPLPEVTLEELSTMIDVDSFIDYYLINEYTQNRESFATSFYWYKDGPEDVLHLGPIWDFDTCMGNDGTAYTGRYGDQHILFRQLLAIPVYRQRVLERAEEMKPLLAQMDERIFELYNELKGSAEMNYLRWNVLGKPNPKGGVDFAETYEDAVASLIAWLKYRETAFVVPEVFVVTGEVSEDCRELSLRFEGGEDLRNVRFAVWSLEDGQDDLVWYTGEQGEDGAWYVVVDLRDHHSSGIYRYDVYHDAHTNGAAATGRNYVDTPVFHDSES